MLAARAGDRARTTAKWWPESLCSRGLDDVHGKQKSGETFLQAGGSRILKKSPNPTDAKEIV